MTIGVVSDTHNNLPNVRRIIRLFNEAGVERVVHTGDISRPRTLEAFSRLEVPLYGVWGNNDEDERHVLAPVAARFGFDFADAPRTLVWHERKILVVHDPLDIDTHLDGHELVLHGHNHQRVIERHGGTLVFNPGECAGHLEGHNAVGVVDLTSLETEILCF